MATVHLTPEASDYPAGLAALGAAPPIYVRGVLPVRPCVAVVGTREPCAEDVAFTRELVRALVERNFSIVSGGAIGIDAAAHAEAIAAGGVTVAVLGGGFERLYPRENEGLFGRILDEGGALVSLVADDVDPAPHRFLARNGVLVALACATIVIAAGYQSGARNAASWARRVGRPLGVVPHAPWDPRGQGCALELALGARAIASTDDALRLLDLKVERRRRAPPADRAATEEPVARVAQVARVAREPPSDPVLACAYVAVEPAPLHVDELCDRAAMKPSEMVVALFRLTLDGFVVEGPPGFFRRS